MSKFFPHAGSLGEVSIRRWGQNDIEDWESSEEESDQDDEVEDEHETENEDQRSGSTRRRHIITTCTRSSFVQLRYDDILSKKLFHSLRILTQCFEQGDSRQTLLLNFRSVLGINVKNGKFRESRNYASNPSRTDLGQTIIHARIPAAEARV